MVRWKISVNFFAGVGWWSEYRTRVGYVLFAHKNLKPRARPRKVFAHASRRVTLNHRLNARTFQLALGQVCFREGAALTDDDKLGVVHGSIVRPDEKERSTSSKCAPDCGTRIGDRGKSGEH